MRLHSTFRHIEFSSNLRIRAIFNAVKLHGPPVGITKPPYTTYNVCILLIAFCLASRFPIQKVLRMLLFDASLEHLHTTTDMGFDRPLWHIEFSSNL